MKKLSLFLTALAGVCSASFAQVGPVPGCPGAFGPTRIITGTHRNDTTSTIKLPGGTVTWVKDTIYIIKDIVRVAPNTTLQLRPGTIVMGFPGPLDTSALIIKMGAKLKSAGAADNPVVLTSCKIQGARNRGDWGGLVICGKGITNLGTNIQLEGNYGAYYGGTDNEDNSGSIQFTRVEFAGFAFEPNKELNGITLGGVGANTIFQNVQVSHANDDSFEWFGGAVDGKNLIAWKGIDDDFDTDNGYSGLNQFGIAYRDFAVADFSGSNGFESDNEAAGDVTNPALSPKTTAIFSNFTMYGPVTRATTPYNRFYKTGALLRRNTELDIYNTFFLGYPGDSTVNDGVQGGKESSGVFISGANAGNNASTGAIRFKKNTVATFNTVSNNRATDNVAGFNAEPWFNTAAFANTFSYNLSPNYLSQTAGALNITPSFRQVPGSPALTGSSFSGSLSGDLPVGNLFATTPAGRGFSNVAYRGATSLTEWAEPWAEYNPALLKYTAGVAPTSKGAAEAFLAGGDGVEVVNGIACVPNPAINTLSTVVRFVMDYETSDAAMTVIDMAGNVVAYQQTGIIAGVNNIPLNTTSLEPGTYIVRVSANGTVAKTTKLSVVR